jgi:hypothetical protein
MKMSFYNTRMRYRVWFPILRIKSQNAKIQSGNRRHADLAAKNLKYRPAQIAVSQKTKNLLITLIIFSTALTGILMIRNIVEKKYDQRKQGARWVYDTGAGEQSGEESGVGYVSDGCMGSSDS